MTTTNDPFLKQVEASKAREKKAAFLQRMQNAGLTLAAGLGLFSVAYWGEFTSPKRAYLGLFVMIALAIRVAIDQKNKRDSYIADMAFMALICLFFSTLILGIPRVGGSGLDFVAAMAQLIGPMTAGASISYWRFGREIDRRAAYAFARKAKG